MKRSKNKTLIVFILIPILTIVSIYHSHAQNIVSKVELKVYPFWMDPPLGLDSELLDSVDLTICFEESKVLGMKTDSIARILFAIKSTESVAISEEYKVKCNLYLTSGQKKYFLMNANGDFFYEGKTYKDDRIKKFVFDYIPELYKKPK